MAKVLQLANNTRTSIYDLRTGAIRWDNWTTAVEEDGCTEAFTLHGVGSDTTIIAAEKSILAMKAKAALFLRDPLYNESIWLETGATDELSKRSWIKSISLAPNPNKFNNPLLGKNAASYLLAIDHHRYFEVLSAETFTASNISCLGGTWLPAVTSGDVDGRIYEFRFEGRALGALSRFWVGVRPLYAGGSNFDPLLELENGTNDTDTSNVADATASGSSKKRCTFGTDATNKRRLYITLAQHDNTNADEYVGRYTALLRCQMTAGQAAVQLKYGQTGQSATFISNEPVYISNTGWRLQELGVVEIPAFGGRLAASYAGIENTQIEIWAESITTGSLDLDCLILIPSENFAWGEGAATQLVDADARQTSFYTFEDDSTIAVYYAGGAVNSILAKDIRKFSWPYGGGVAVIAGERSTSSVLGDAVNLVTTVYPRWDIHRSS